MKRNNEKKVPSYVKIRRQSILSVHSKDDTIILELNYINNHNSNSCRSNNNVSNTGSFTLLWSECKNIRGLVHCRQEFFPNNYNNCIDITAFCTKGNAEVSSFLIPWGLMACLFTPSLPQNVSPPQGQILCPYNMLVILLSAWIILPVILQQYLWWDGPLVELY